MNEQTLTRYLLGELSEEDQARVEEQLFADDECFQQIHALRAELADKYVRGQLGGRERRQYETRFLATVTGRQDTLFAQALTQVLPTPNPETVRAVVTEEKPTFWESITALFRLPAFGIGAALACLLLVGAGLWFYQEARRLRGLGEQAEIARKQAEVERHKQQELQDELARAKASNNALQQQLEEMRAQTKQEKPAPSPTTSRTLHTLLSFLLLPSGVRGNQQPTKITVPPSTGRLQIQLDLDQSSPAQSYRAELRTARGRLMQRQSRLTAHATAAGQAVFFVVQAQSLPPDNYEVALEGFNVAGEKTDTNYYSFTLLRR